MTRSPHTEPGGDPRDHPRRALERAQQLSHSRPQAGDDTAWYHESLQVGDLSALAIAFAAERSGSTNSR